MTTVNELADQLLKKGVASSRLDAKKMAEQMLSTKAEQPQIVRDVHDTVRTLQKELREHKNEVSELKDEILKLKEAHQSTQELIRQALSQDLLSSTDPIEEELAEGSPNLRDIYNSEEKNISVEKEIEDEIESSRTESHN